MSTFTETSLQGKSWTKIMKVSDMICVADFHGLCPPQSPRRLVAKAAQWNLGFIRFTTFCIGNSQQLSGLKET